MKKQGNYAAVKWCCENAPRPVEGKVLEVTDTHITLDHSFKGKGGITVTYPIQGAVIYWEKSRVASEARKDFITQPQPKDPMYELARQMITGLIMSKMDVGEWESLKEQMEAKFSPTESVYDPNSEGEDYLK